MLMDSNMRITITFILIFLCPLIVVGQIYRLDERNFPTVRVWYLPRDNAERVPPTRIDDNRLPVQVLEHTCSRSSWSLPADIVVCVDITISNHVWRENRFLLDTIAATIAQNLRSSDVRLFLVPFANTATMQPLGDVSELPIAVKKLQFQGGTNYTAAFDTSAALWEGPVDRERWIIFITDGLDTLNLDRIRSRFAGKVPHVAVIMIRNEAPPSLRTLAVESDGGWFELISSADAAAQAAEHISRIIRGDALLCSVRYNAIATCTERHDIQMHFPRATYGIRYQAPRTASLELSTSHVYFGVPLIGTTRDASITLTARGLPVRLDTAWMSGSPGFSIATPISTTLLPDQPAVLTVRYRARDTNAAWGELHIRTSCGEHIVTFSVGRRLALVVPSPFRIVTPVGGERYWSGSDVPISWLGIPPDDSCSIAISYDDGRSWQQITDAASNYRWRWKVPPLDLPRQVLIELRRRMTNRAQDVARLSKPITIEPTSGVIHPVDVGQSPVGLRKDTVLRGYIRNVSPVAPLIIERIEFLGDAAGDFGISSGTFPATIPPGGTLDVELFFRPSSHGRRTAELLIVSPSGYVRDVLWGHGTGSSPIQMIVDFGSVEIHSSRDESIFHSFGDASPAIEWNGDSSAFQITVSRGSRVMVTFRPDSVRSYHATARFRDRSSSLTLELNGRGIPPAPTVQDPTHFRTLILPTAQSLRSGTFGVGSYDGVGLLGFYAPTDAIALFAGGLLPIHVGGQRSTAIGIGGRFAYRMSDQWSIAAGGAIASTRTLKQADSTEILLAAPFALATIQLGSIRINGGIGYAFKEHQTPRMRYRADVPLIAVGGDVQIASHWKVALDMLHAGTVEALPIATSVRYFGQQFALDGGIMLSIPTTSREKFFVLPVVSAFWIFR